MSLTRRQQRMVLVVILLAGLSIATALALTAFQKNLLHFYDPTQVVAGEAPVGPRVRIGGLVKQHSVHRSPDSLAVSFVVADCQHEIPVTYEGILPDLFREGQGIVAYGRLQPDMTFTADEVLAKHDENYMPPEVAESLSKSEGVDCMPSRMGEY